MALQPTNRFDKPWTPNNRTWINYLTPIVTPPTPPSTDNTRAPLFTRIARAAWVAAVLIPVLPNLNTTTLASVAPPPPPPVIPQILDNPRGPVFPIALRTFIGTKTQEAAAPVQAPFVPEIFDNPQVPRRSPHYTYNAQTHLIGQDQFFGAPGQAPRYDYPNPPLAARRANPHYTFNAQTHLIGQDYLPFRQQNWQNPQAKRRGQDFTGPNLSGTTLAPAVVSGTPFVPPDFPNPPRKTYDLTTHTIQVRLPAEETQSIFTYDWPNPRQRPYPAGLRTWTNTDLLATTLAGVLPPAPPFIPIDFPNPLQPRRNPQYIYSAQTQLIGKDALPNRQQDWQNPAGARRLTGLSWTQPVTQFLPPPTKPFLQSDWPLPNPKPRYNARQYTHGDNHNPNLEVPPAIQIATGKHNKRKWRRSG